MALEIGAAYPATGLTSEAVVRALMVQGRTPPTGGNELDVPSFGEKYVSPRFNPAIWLQPLEDNSRLRRCCEVIARSSVGLGAFAAPVTKAADMVSGRRNLGNKVKRDVETLQGLIDHPNLAFVPFSEVLYQAELELQACGNGFIEAVEEDREAGRPVAAILHAPAAYIRVHASGDKYVRLLRNSGRKIYFRRLGDDDPDHRFINKYTGEFYAEWPAKLAESWRGTALVHARNYSPLDEFYGVPPWAPAVNAVAGNKMIGRWNLNFLQNNAHIPIAVIVEDGTLSEDSMEQISLFLSREGSGLKNAGRLLVLQPDTKSAAMGKGVKIRLQDLKVGITDDASFLKYRVANDDEVQQVYGVAGIFLATGSTTRATAMAEKQITYEQVVLPRARFWAFVLNSIIAPRLGNGTAKFEFVKPANLDPGQMAAVVQKLSQALTINDLRRMARELLQDRSLMDLPGHDETPLAVLSLSPPQDTSSVSRSVQDEVLAIGRMAA